MKPWFYAFKPYSHKVSCINYHQEISKFVPDLITKVKLSKVKFGSISRNIRIEAT